jgi:Ser/Thr protein kinase RdoA (MazF antagonist)
VLRHLARAGVSVSQPIARKDGGWTLGVEAVEGRRQVVLFQYAEGQPTPQITEAFAALYGRAAAALHAATDDFASRYPRFELGLAHLLDQPLAEMAPLLAHRPADWEYLVDLARRLREGVAALPVGALDRGFCHGDFHHGNAHVAGDRLTLFDFDCCGTGWRAYDIAVFRWGVQQWCEAPKALWTAFLQGYTEAGGVSPEELAAVPLFVAIRQIWIMGMQAENAPDWGYAQAGDAYFDEALAYLRRCEADL